MDPLNYSNYVTNEVNVKIDSNYGRNYRNFLLNNRRYTHDEIRSWRSKLYRIQYKTTTCLTEAKQHQ